MVIVSYTCLTLIDDYIYEDSSVIDLKGPNPFNFIIENRISVIDIRAVNKLTQCRAACDLKRRSEAKSLSCIGFIVQLPDLKVENGKFTRCHLLSKNSSPTQNLWPKSIYNLSEIYGVPVDYPKSIPASAIAILQSLLK